MILVSVLVRIQSPVVVLLSLVWLLLCLKFYHVWFSCHTNLFTYNPFLIPLSTCQVAAFFFAPIPVSCFICKLDGIVRAYGCFFEFEIRFYLYTLYGNPSGERGMLNVFLIRKGRKLNINHQNEHI